MADVTITGLPTASGIDASADWIPIDRTSLGVTQKINRNTMLGITGSPVGTSDTQILTNKTITQPVLTVDDDDFTLQDNLDTTKKLQFQLSGITAATTRTLTVPNASTTIVGTDATQTLTNKTLTAPTITNGSITGTTITTNAIVGQTSATSGTVYGLSVTSGEINGVDIINSTITTSQIASSTITGANINWSSALAPNGVWWQEIGRTTLSGAADTISVSNFSARKYITIIVWLIATGGTINSRMTFNGDTGANYAYNSSNDFGASGTATAVSFIAPLSTAAADPQHFIYRTINVAAQEKIGHTFNTIRGGAGAANFPTVRQLGGKWANTAAQITTVTITNTGTGDYAIGSEMVILGHD